MLAGGCNLVAAVAKLSSSPALSNLASGSRHDPPPRYRCGMEDLHMWRWYGATLRDYRRHKLDCRYELAASGGQNWPCTDL